MKKIWCLLVFFSFLMVKLPAQYKSNEPVLVIGKRSITAAEFERIYAKNFSINTVEKQSIEDYFTLFLKFELKVCAAIDAGLDTLTSFRQELKTYRDQLAKTYLTDNETLDYFIREAYDRMQKEVHVSHIMVRLPQNPTPDDTLKAYQKISDILKRVKSGESFEKLATELSEDPSVKTNKGDLGYFSVFRMVYSFESGAYLTPTGKISNIIRTQFGYHILKNLGFRPYSGEVKVAHIMVAVPQDAPEEKWTEAKVKIDNINQRVRAGENFGALAKEFSDDQNSGRNGGELPSFSSGQMVPEFEIPAFALKNPGDISEPVKTSFGWHIIKLIEKQGIKPFDQIKNELKSKVLRDERATLTSHSFIVKLEKKYSCRENVKNLFAFNQLDSTLYQGKFNFKQPQPNLNTPVFTIENTNFTGSDFLNFLKTTPPPVMRTPVKDYIQTSFRNFKEKTLLNFEDSNLEKNNVEFRQMVEEYHDGILLFNIMEDKVWMKATKDTLGLTNYYETYWKKKNPDTKSFNEVKGLVTSDYQNYLEEKWIEELKNKYKVSINQELLHKIAEKYTAKK